MTEHSHVFNISNCMPKALYNNGMQEGREVLLGLTISMYIVREVQTIVPCETLQVIFMEERCFSSRFESMSVKRDALLQFQFCDVTLKESKRKENN